MRSLGHSGSIDPDDERAGWPPLKDFIACLPQFARMLNRHRRAAHLMRGHQTLVDEMIRRFDAKDPDTLADAEIWSTIHEWTSHAPHTIEVILTFGGVVIFEAEDFGAEFTPELRAQEERLRAQAAENAKQ